MSVTVWDRVWGLRGINPTFKFVLSNLADRANDRGESCYPSVGLIAAETGYRRRTVQRALRYLERHGFIRPVGQTASGTTMWIIELAMLPSKRQLGERQCRGEHGRSSDAPQRKPIAAGGDTGSPEPPTQPSREPKPSAVRSRARFSQSDSNGSLQVLRVIANEEISLRGGIDADLVDTREAVKVRAAQLRIPYDSTVVGKAVDMGWHDQWRAGPKRNRNQVAQDCKLVVVR